MIDKLFVFVSIDKNEDERVLSDYIFLELDSAVKALPHIQAIGKIMKTEIKLQRFIKG